jgi:hypothetical protein
VHGQTCREGHISDWSIWKQAEMKIAAFAIFDTHTHCCKLIEYF